MKDDKEERLNKLIELRNSGVLTEAEFQIAKTRVLAARQPAKGTTIFDGPSIWQSYWPALLGLGILLLLIVGVIVYGRMAAEEDTIDLNMSVTNDIGADNVLEAAQTGSEICASAGTYARIQELIFDGAQRQFGGDPGPLDSLRRAVGVRMQYPLLRGIRQDDGRTDCSGHVILDLPPSVRPAFDGAPALEADVQYSVQPAAGGTGNVVEITGADEVIQQLAVAASLVGGGQKVPVEAASVPKIFNPSFDCRGTLSNVERMICEDEQLSQLDRALAARYLALRRELRGPEWDLVSESQRDFLRRRARCADVACLHDAYVAQARYLDRFLEG